MSEDIPDDIMVVAATTSNLVAKSLIAALRSGSGNSMDEAADRCANIIATALHTERKKWDGASTFKRCMEK